VPERVPPARPGPPFSAPPLTTSPPTTSPPHRPAYSRESVVLRLPAAISLDDLTPEWAWGGSTGRGVRVAVIDSGIDADHPALEGCVDRDGGLAITMGPDGEFVETVGPHADSFGHGTACAGVIHSFAPEARITSVKVLGEGVGGKAAAFLRGLAWAVEQRFQVINLSLGTNRREWALPFYEVCDRAYFQGSVLVTAANNMPRPSFPSLYGTVISVACNGTTDPWRFHFNPDPPTEFLARGIDVRLPWRGGGYITTTGNSFAAPHLSGLVALIMAKHPELRPFQVKTVLWATAANVREAPPASTRSTITNARRTMTMQVGNLFSDRQPGRPSEGLSPSALPPLGRPDLPDRPGRPGPAG
jgi:subtilisin